MNGLKMHLRVISARRQTLRVITLRAQTTVRFSTNYFHDTWHVLTDAEGARVLARILWALSFQRIPGTCVLLTGAHLVPTPFEADPALPVLLMQDGLARADAELLRAVKRRRHDDGSGTTIRLHTFGMEEKMRERDELGHRSRWFHDEMRTLRAREKMQRVAGFIVYSAPPEILREQALTIHRMHAGKYPDYHYLAEGARRFTHSPPGEVQVFRGMGDMVSAAKVARREVLGPIESRHAVVIADEAERRAVQLRAEIGLERLVRARRHSPT